MGRFSEETFKHWHRPASETEETRISNAIRMIKDGLGAHEKLKELTFDVFVQGSYGNNTNIRKDSDIDICIMLTSSFMDKCPPGKTIKNYGFQTGPPTFNQYRGWIIDAMNAKFGNEGFDVGNKSIKIHSNSYRLQADVVPAIQYRDYSKDLHENPTNYKEGIYIVSSSGEEVINYPKIHIENGKLKNSKTQKRFKKMVRIFKRVKVQMKKEGKSVPKGITSFLLSGLIWNLPNHIFNDNDTWEKRMKAAIYYLWNNTQKEETCKEWGEVSEKFYLFHASRKWTREETNTFLKNMWNFLEFN